MSLKCTFHVSTCRLESPSYVKAVGPAFADRYGFLLYCTNRFNEMQNRALQLLAVTIVFLACAWVTVGLRCIVRLKLVKAFGLDDYLIVVSLVRKAIPDSRQSGVWC
jgi:hypothetical protein